MDPDRTNQTRVTVMQKLSGKGFTLPRLVLAAVLLGLVSALFILPFSGTKAGPLLLATPTPQPTTVEIYRPKVDDQNGDGFCYPPAADQTPGTGYGPGEWVAHYPGFAARCVSL